MQGSFATLSSTQFNHAVNNSQYGTYPVHT